jgi:hypothetical protein
MDEALKVFAKYVTIGKEPTNLQTAKDILAAFKK